MPRFQFTLRDLFWMTTIIALGMGLMVMAINNANAIGYGVALGVGMVSFGILGIGIGVPFHNTALGMTIAYCLFIIVGFVLQLLSSHI